MNKILSKKCIVCNKEFVKIVNCSRREWRTRLYCSQRCAKINQHKIRPFGYKFSKERHFVPKTAIKKGQHLSSKTQFKKGFVPWNKGKEGIMPIPWNKGKKFLQISKEKHHNWKGGISRFSDTVRSSLENTEWRRFVFKRDNYTCVKCGRKRKPGDRVELEADHYPKRFSDILREYGIKTLADALACKILWDVNNGRTLCKECHKIATRLLMLKTH